MTVVPQKYSTRSKYCNTSAMRKQPSPLAKLRRVLTINARGLWENTNSGLRDSFNVQVKCEQVNRVVSIINREWKHNLVIDDSYMYY